MVRLIVPKPRLICRGWPLRARFDFNANDQDQISEYSVELSNLPAGLVVGPDYPFDGILEGVVAFPFQQTLVADLVARDATVQGSEAYRLDRREWRLELQDNVIPHGLGLPLRYYVGPGGRARVRISTWSEQASSFETVAELDLELEAGELSADVLSVCASDLAARRREYRLPALVNEAPQEFAQRLDVHGARPYVFSILSLSAEGEATLVVDFPPVWVLDAEREAPGGYNLGSFVNSPTTERLVQAADTPEVLRVVNKQGSHSVSLTLNVEQGVFSRAYGSRVLLAEQRVLHEEPTACAVGPRGMLVAGRADGRLQIVESTDGGASWSLLCDLTGAGILSGRSDVKIAEVWYRGQLPMGLLVSLVANEPWMRVFALKRSNTGDYHAELVEQISNFSYLNSYSAGDGKLMIACMHLSGNLAILACQDGYLGTAQYGHVLSGGPGAGNHTCIIIGETWILGDHDKIQVSLDNGQTFEQRPTLGPYAEGISGQLGNNEYGRNSCGLWSDGEKVILVSPSTRAAISQDLGISWQPYVLSDVFPVSSVSINEPDLRYALFGASADTLVISHPAAGRLARALGERISIDTWGGFYPTKACSYAGTTLLIGLRNNPPMAGNSSSLAFISRDGGLSYTPAGYFGVVEFVPRQIIGYEQRERYRGINNYMLIFNMAGQSFSSGGQFKYDPDRLMESDDMVLVYRSRTGGLESLVLPSAAGKREADVSRTIAETDEMVSGPVYRTLAEERSTPWLSRPQALKLLDELAVAGQAWVWRNLGGDGWVSKPVVLDMKKYALQTRAGLAAVTVRWRESDGH